MLTPRSLGTCAAILISACASGELPPAESIPVPDTARTAEGRPEAAAAAPAGLPRLAVAVALADPSLGGFGERVVEGVRLAVEEGGMEVDLLVEDRGGAAGVAAAEAGGALVVIGPLDEQALVTASEARTDPELALVSPTASRAPFGARNVYALNGEDVRGAEALAAWAGERGLRTVGLLYPSIPGFMAQAEAFRRVAERNGARVVDRPFAPGTTTFGEPLEELAAAGVQAVFIPGSERDVRQIAPQVRYFGLDGVRILGNEAWVSAEVLRGVDRAVLEGVVAATPVSPEDEEAWEAFARRYEERFRRSLDSPAAALGHDAALLVLEALAGGGDRAAVARRLAAVTELRGATGLLSVRDGAITRRPYLVMIRDGRVGPVAR
ncbi:MAG: ABC transporter substrate-binding protein [Gemmatimonadota bacterium]